MTAKAPPISLDLDELRALGGWAADCAERALPVFETSVAADARPKEAIAGIREFASGGKRVHRLRVLSLAAFAAARETDDPAASAAASAAGLAASSAYTHPLADVQQTKHIVGPAAYAVLALELAHPDEPDPAERELRRATEAAPAEVRDILLRMPAREPGRSRISELMYAVDSGLRHP